MRTLTLSNSDARKLVILLQDKRDNVSNLVDRNMYQRMLNAFSSKFYYKRMYLKDK
jgi:hypothetical protein